MVDVVGNSAETGFLNIGRFSTFLKTLGSASPSVTCAEEFKAVEVDAVDFVALTSSIEAALDT